MSTLPEKRPPEPEGPVWKPILLVAAGIYTVVFLILNNDEVQISFVFFKIKTSAIFLVLVSMALGALLALAGPSWLRRRRTKSQPASPPSP